jgi:hypothetical protein
MVLKRSKNLDDRAIEEIVQIIDGWAGKLTWELLIEAISKRKHQEYRRQALFNHVRIRDAFALKKKRLREGGDEVASADVSPEVQALLQVIARLESENARLKNENNNLLAQFARWAHNAGQRNLDEDFLNQPLPSINRGQTDPDNPQRR